MHRMRLVLALSLVGVVGQSLPASAQESVVLTFAHRSQPLDSDLGRGAPLSAKIREVLSGSAGDQRRLATKLSRLAVAAGLNVRSATLTSSLDPLSLRVLRKVTIRGTAASAGGAVPKVVDSVMLRAPALIRTFDQTVLREARKTPRDQRRRRLR